MKRSMRGWRRSKGVVKTGIKGFDRCPEVLEALRCA